MIPLLLILTAAISYFLGSLSSPILLARFVFHKDIARPGSYVGYNSFVRHFGRTWGLAVVGADILKSLVAVVIGGLLLTIPGDGFPVVGRLFAGFCVVLGDIWPIRYGFRGGKGVICLYTALWIADWRVGLFVIAVFVGALALSQYMSLSSLAGCLTGVAATWIFVDQAQMKGTAGLLVLFSFLCILWRHRGNISKLLAHREQKIVWGRRAESRLREDNF